MILTGLSLFPHIKYGCIHWKNKRLAHGAHWRRDIHKAGVLIGDLATISFTQKNIFSSMDHEDLSPPCVTPITERGIKEPDCGENVHNLKEI